MVTEQIGGWGGSGATSAVQWPDLAATQRWDRTHKLEERVGRNWLRQTPAALIWSVGAQEQASTFQLPSEAERRGLLASLRERAR